MRNPFRYFNSSPEVIRLAVMMSVRYRLSLRQVEDLLVERGIDVCHETVRFWWNRFGPLFAGEIGRQRVARRGIVKLTDCRLFSAFLHEVKPLKLCREAIDNLPRFRSESG